MFTRLVALAGFAALGLSSAHADGIRFPWQQQAPAQQSRTADAGPDVSQGTDRAGGRGFLSGIFAPKRAPVAPVAPETMQKDALLASHTAKRPFTVKPEFQPQSVRFTGYQSGTIVIDTKARFLYLVESRNTARRYPIAVGREGMLFTGEATIGDLQEWPRWFPTKDMIKNEASKYAKYSDGMDGGLSNPLGARAIYLYQGKRDTYIRIHGTNDPRSVGTAASHGCFRMYNQQVMDLYTRVKMGEKVVVL